jgi:3-deoxy-D-manno-octulosonic-acid transferase
MGFLYDCFILAYRIFSRLLAPFNPKARLFVAGRRGLLKRLSKALEGRWKPVIWFHCASLGEFEQGRPLIAHVRESYPDHIILLTFFSPSGYEMQKEYDKADVISYMPLDTRSNARRFVDLVKPVLAVFVKYEFWHHHIAELARRKVPVISVSAIFRPGQIFFKSYGGFYRRILQRFTHLFVQNDESLRLLRNIGIRQCSRAGDTRFDRVFEIVQCAEEIPIARDFKGSSKAMVVGSCWPDDMEVLTPFINNKAGSGELKFILAPHEISEAFIQRIIGSLDVPAIRYSQASGADLDSCRVLIIDNIGMLSRLYRYGEFAFVGGAYGDGLHNILEAACYGVPVFFGNRNYRKFAEAVELIRRGAAFPIADYPGLLQRYEQLRGDEDYRIATRVAEEYVRENLGATKTILQYLDTILRRA